MGREGREGERERERERGRERAPVHTRGPKGPLPRTGTSCTGSSCGGSFLCRGRAPPGPCRHIAQFYSWERRGRGPSTGSETCRRQGSPRTRSRGRSSLCGGKERERVGRRASQGDLDSGPRTPSSQAPAHHHPPTRSKHREGSCRSLTPAFREGESGARGRGAEPGHRAPGDAVAGVASDAGNREGRERVTT